jgi:hypothetical protein
MVPHFLDNRLTDGGKDVSLARRPSFTPQEDSWYSVLLEAESTPGPYCGWKDEEIYLIETRTRDLPACSIVPQPTTLQHAPIFMDTSKYRNFFVSSLHNGLSDHEGQLLTIVLPLLHKIEHYTYSYRKINNSTVADFQKQLSYENWHNIFGEKNVNLIFNSFLKTHLRIFNSSFPIRKKHMSSKRTSINWITPGIRNSCKHKKDLYLMMKSNNNLFIKVYYNRYCKILNKVIIAAKKMAYDNCIKKSHNKLNTTWKIINTGQVELQSMIIHST